LRTRNPNGDEERVFDKFYRARPDGGGVGLGLTICRGIVEAHAAGFGRESPEGGALFQFTLPLEGRPPEFKPEEMEYPNDSTIYSATSAGCQIIPAVP